MKILQQTLNINEVDVWSVCYEDDYQFTGKPTNNEKSYDSTNSSEQSTPTNETDSSEQSKSTNDNNSSESKNNQESQNDSDNTIFCLIFCTIVYEIAKKLLYTCANQQILNLNYELCLTFL